jgi:uncharacterized protein
MMDGVQPYGNIFCIPHRGNHIVYLPLPGVILLANSTFVNLLYHALHGDKEAIVKLGVDSDFVVGVQESERMAAHLTHPRPLEEFAPTSVSLFLTNDCTLRCRYCYADGGTNNRQMPWEMVDGILTSVAQNVVRLQLPQMGVHFHGGGDVSAAWPLVVRTRKHLHDLTTSHQIKSITSIGLNGILNSEQQRWIVDNIDSATVSLDGPPVIHDSQRPFPNGQASFPAVHQTLKAFDAARYPYAIRTTVTSESVNHLEEIVSFFCENYEVKRIKCEPMYPRGRGLQRLLHAPDAVTFVEQFRKARALANQAGRELTYSGARLEVLTNVFCQAAGNSCAVTPEGWVTSCYEVLNPGDPFAEVFFYGRFNPVLQKFEIDEERRKRLSGLSVLNKPFCARCFCQWHCAGDCPVKSLHAERSPSDGIPDRCYISRELTKDQLIEAVENA